MSDDAAAAKNALRVAHIAARSGLTAAVREAAGAAIADHGAQRWRGARVIAAYLSVGTEPPTGPMIEDLRLAGATVLLPVIDGDRLEWALYTGPADVARGPLGINEPTGERLGAAAVADAEVVFVPALAVDRRGNRLGRGRGFYDRALAVTTAELVAVVYDDELLDDVPVEDHDRRVDASLRPAGIRPSS